MNEKKRKNNMRHNNNILYLSHSIQWKTLLNEIVVVFNLKTQYDTTPLLNTHLYNFKLN